MSTSNQCSSGDIIEAGFIFLFFLVFILRKKQLIIMMRFNHAPSIL